MKTQRPKRRLDIPSVSGKFGTGTTVYGDKHEYLIGPIIGQTTISDLYRATPGVGDPAVIKIVRDVDDNDLAVREIEILSWLSTRITNGRNNFPTLVEAIDVSDEEGKRKALVFPYNPNYYTLAEVIAAYPKGVPPQHAAWMLNRMLEAIHFVNYHGGVVHGALLPYNFLVGVDSHAGMLTEWSFAARDEHVVMVDGKATTAQGEHIVAIDENYRAWYPPEVLAKEPHNFSVDLWMFARCAVLLLGGNPVSGTLPATVPKALAGFLRYITANKDASKRPQIAMTLHDELGVILKNLYGKRTFLKFDMPARA